MTLISACNAPKDSVTIRAVEELGTRVGELEARVANLETSAKSPAAAPAAAPPAGDMAGGGAPTETGYEGVYVRFTLDNSEASLLINGRVAGAYSKSEAVYIETMLAPGTVNRIGAAFSEAKTGNKFEIQVKSRGDDRWNTVFNFTPTMQKLESSFDVPFLGAAQ
jgi:hypothetical protein